jgi:hypothetical protein
VKNVPGSITGTLRWTPQLSQARMQPYPVAFRAFQYHNQNVFSLDEPLLLYVDQNTSTNSILNKGNIIVYPNLSNGRWNLSLILEKSSDVVIEISDITGKTISTVMNSQLPAGANLIRSDYSNLKAAYYFVNVKIDGVKSVSIPLVIQ